MVFYIFQGPDAVYYNAAIGKNMKMIYEVYEVFFLKCTSNQQIMKSSKLYMESLGLNKLTKC